MATTLQQVIAPEGTSSGTVTNGTETYAYLWPGDNRGLRIDIERESETGTCTLAAKLQWVNAASGDVNDFLDRAGNAIAFNDWADGETGKRFIDIHPENETADTDGVLAVGNNFYFRANLMDHLQLVLTHGGTGVVNVYNITVTWLP